MSLSHGRYEAEIVRDEEQVAQSAKRKKCWRTVPAGGAKGPANAHAKAAARKARAAAAAAATVDDAVPDAASGPSCVSLASAAPSQGAELESAGLGSSSEASASEAYLYPTPNLISPTPVPPTLSLLAAGSTSHLLMAARVVRYSQRVCV